MARVAIDGKTLRGSADGAGGRKTLHLVSAWATDRGLPLGQRAAAEKPNEITAIPELLEVLDLKGCLVSIDAMGCQTDIAAAVGASGADYLLQVKDNQPTLRAAVERLAADAVESGACGPGGRRPDPAPRPVAEADGVPAVAGRDEFGGDARDAIDRPEAGLVGRDEPAVGVPDAEPLAGGEDGDGRASGSL